MTKPADAAAAPGWDGRPGDWIRLASAARILGCSRQNANLMAHDGKFNSLATIDDGNMFVVSRKEVEGIVALRERASEPV